MTIYATLDEALQDIANRSFYEDAIITPGPDGFTVEGGTVGSGYIEDDVSWSQADGMSWPDSALDHSRLHESYESYDAPSHIDYNLPVAVETLKEGKPVGFAYVIVYESECEDCAAGYPCDDNIAGWALIAFDESTN